MFRWGRRGDVPPVITLEQLGDLVSHIDTTAHTPDEKDNNISGCDHTLRLASDGLSWTTLTPSTSTIFSMVMVGFCDREVCFNVTNLLDDPPSVE
jgi:hypothetical protein